MKINEIQSKSILSRSGVYDYALNPYVGCQHACMYCYARFMKRFTGHSEPWGGFVDAKINAPDLLRKEIQKKKRGTVWMSGVCDPYQPLEARYGLSGRCLEILAQSDWPVVIQTRSPLVLRDLEIIKGSKNIDVGLTITTADDEVRKVFEPLAPPIPARLKAIATLRHGGVRTYAMIAPILPGAEELIGLLAGKIDCVIIDRMNYNYADRIYRRHGWRKKSTDEYFDAVRNRMAAECLGLGLVCRAAY